MKLSCLPFIHSFIQGFI